LVFKHTKVDRVVWFEEQRLANEEALHEPSFCGGLAPVSRFAFRKEEHFAKPWEVVVSESNRIEDLESSHKGIFGMRDDHRRPRPFVPCSRV
jgi:hypothetical protein